MTQALNARYGTLAQTFHWVTAVVVLVAFAMGPEGSEKQIYQPSGDFERQLHETLGLCVFALTFLRVLWKKIHTPPQAPPLARWMELSAKLVQSALYLLLFAVPLTAIAGAWLEGHPLTLLGGTLIASPVAISHDLGGAISNLHTLLGDAIVWIAGAHALAAIYHQVVLKDEVLSTMLPSWFALWKR